MLFWEQEIMIASILTAIGMAICVLVKALLPSGTDGAAGGAAHKPPLEKEKGLKEWIRKNWKP